MLENYDHIIILKNFESKIDQGGVKVTQVEKYKQHLELIFKTYMNKRLITLEITEKGSDLHIGLILQQDMFNVRTEKGPIYGTEEAKQFADLWGNRSKIMHIDGNIHECVLWPKEGNLMLKIVDFIMKEKLGFPPHGLNGGWHQIYADQLNKCIKQAVLLNTNKKEVVNINSAFDVLRDSLCAETAPEAIKKLPVNIQDIRAVGPWSKQTNIFTERCITVNGFRQDESIYQINNAYNVYLNVETNNKWPSEHDAFTKMKILFLIKISKALYESKKIYSKLLMNGSLDVHIKGFVFRCTLVIDKEFNNLRRSINDGGFREIGKKNKKAAAAKNVESTKPLLTLQEPIRNWMLKHRIIPDINNQIRVFSSQFGQVYIDTCRIVKRWMCSHFIDILDDDNERMTEMYLKSDENKGNHLYGYCFTEISIELIVASLFIHPNKEYKREPQSSLSGFIRFLKFFSEFNWTYNPLIINVKEGFTDVQMDELMKPFKASDNRHTELSAMVLRMPGNLHGDHFTSQGPNMETLESTKLLAKQAYVSIKHLLYSDSDLTPIFLVDKTKFDVLFHLQSATLNLLLAHCIDTTDTEVKTLKFLAKKKLFGDRKFQFWPKDYEDSPIDSVIEWIREIVETDAVCSYDKYGGRFIGLKWLRNDVDKDLILKSICSKARQFISECEILK